MGQETPKPDILIAEDLPALREPLVVALRQAGFEVRSAANGLEALREVELRKPDLLLLDLAMPELDGVECLRELRRTYGKDELPVIILTAHSEHTLVQDVIKLGVHDFFLKSTFSLVSLLEKVQNALNRGTTAQLRSSSADAGTSASTPLRTAERRQSSAAPSRGVSRNGPTPSHTSADGSGLRPLLSRAEMEQRLKRLNELKGFSPAVASLVQTIDSPSSSLDQIVESAGLDQALATRFLWLANSAAYSRGAAVTSLRKAIVRIGTEKLREAAVTIGILDRFGHGSSNELHYGRFWEHSITVASAAAELTRMIPTAQELEPDVAFTMGLMHDIGRLMLLEELGDLYEEVVETARRRQMPLHKAEAKLLLTTHAKAAQEPLLRWRFPSRLVRPIGFHHFSVQAVRALDAASRLPTSVLVLANALAQVLILGDSGEEAIEDVLVLADDLAMESDFLSRLQGQILESWRDLRTIVVMKSWQDWPDRISVLRESIPDSLRPRFVGSGTQMIQIFFDRLLRPYPNDVVNTWILEADDHHEARRLFEEVLEFEERIPTRNPLPVLMLAGAELDMPYQENRATTILREPFCVNAIIDALRALRPRTAPQVS